jgi:copper chaperone CopZ
MMSYVARVGLWLLLVAGGGLADGWAATGPSYRLEVAGLACPFCAYGIEKQLYRLEGIAQVETHIGEGAVIITMEEGARLDRPTATRAGEASSRCRRNQVRPRQHLPDRLRRARLRHAMSVAAAEDGSVYVVDFLNHRVQKWRPKEH